MKSLHLGSLLTCICITLFLTINMYSASASTLDTLLLTAVLPEGEESSEPLGDPVAEIPGEDPYPENYVEIGQLQLIENSISDELSMWATILIAAGGVGFIASITWIIAGAMQPKNQVAPIIRDDERPMQNTRPQQRRNIPNQNITGSDYDDGYVNKAARRPTQESRQGQNQRPQQSNTQAPQRRSAPAQRDISSQSSAKWDDFSSNSSQPTQQTPTQRHNYNDGFNNSTQNNVRRMRTLDDVKKDKQAATEQDKKKSSSAYDTQEILNEFFK